MTLERLLMAGTLCKGRCRTVSQFPLVSSAGTLALMLFHAAHCHCHSSELLVPWDEPSYLLLSQGRLLHPAKAAGCSLQGSLPLSLAEGGEKETIQSCLSSWGMDLSPESIGSHSRWPPHLAATPASLMT